MPTPREAYTNQVEQRGYAGARIQTADFGAAGETIGRATEGFGKVLGDVGEELRAIDKHEQEIAAQDGFNRSTASVRARLYEGENAFFNTEGQLALDQNKTIWDEVNAIDQEVEAGLANRPHALRLYRESVARRNGDLRQTANTFVDKEFDKYTDGVLAAGVTQHTQLAASALTLEESETHMLTAGNLAQQSARRKGILDETALLVVRQEAQGRAVLGRIANLEIENPTLAMEYLEANRANVLETTYNETRALLAPLVRNNASRGEVDSFIQEELGRLAGTAATETPPAAGAAPPAAAQTTTARETPLDLGPVRSGFGPRDRPALTNGGRGSANHSGWDLTKFGMGTPVPVTMSGRVVKVETQRGYGSVVEVDHGNGLTTFYAHLSAQGVKVGDTVKQGDIIGKAGATGGVSGPHLHYETRENGESVDPSKVHGRELAVGTGGTAAAGAGGDVTEGRNGRIDGEVEARIRERIKNGGYSEMKEMSLLDALDKAVSTGLQQDSRAKARATEIVQAAMNLIPDGSLTDITKLPTAAREAALAYPDVHAGVLREIQQNKDRIEAERQRVEAKNEAAAAAAQGRMDKINGEFAYMDMRDTFRENPPAAAAAWARQREAMIGVIPRTEWRYFDDMANHITANGGLPKAEVGRSTVARRIKPLMESVGLTVPRNAQGRGRDTKAREVREAEDAVTDAVQAWQHANPSRTLTESVLLEIAAPLLRQVEVRTRAGDVETRRVYDIDRSEVGTVFIPQAERNAIEATLKRRGLPHSFEDVTRGWMKERGL